MRPRQAKAATAPIGANGFYEIQYRVEADVWDQRLCRRMAFRQSRS